MAPALETFLLALSKSQGADPTLASQYGGSAARNGEPFGETGMVRKGDAASGDQNGGPRDPQGPVVKAKQDVKVSAGIQSQWETAAESAPLDSAAAMSAISEATLATIVEEAKLVWTEMLGAGDGRLAVLNRVNVQFGNLPGDRLGLTLGVNVYIDSDAAGRGWLTMDLLSVVAHEFGHLLGFDHNDAGAVPVMNATLEAGVHNQFAIVGNVAASPGLAGFVTGADNAQQVIGLQPNGVSVTVSIDGLGSAGWTMLAYSGGDVGSDWKGAVKHYAYGGRDEDPIDMDDSQTLLGVDNQPGIAIEAGTGASDVATKAVHLLRADLTAALDPMPRKAASVPRAAVDALVAMSLDWTTSDFQDFSDLSLAQKDGSRAVVTTPAPDDWVELSLATAGGAGDEVPALGQEGVDWSYAFDGWLSHGWRKSGPAGLHQPP
jgi:hypothetical protein